MYFNPMYYLTPGGTPKCIFKAATAAAGRAVGLDGAARYYTDVWAKLHPKLIESFNTARYCTRCPP